MLKPAFELNNWCAVEQYCNLNCEVAFVCVLSRKLYVIVIAQNNIFFLNGHPVRQTLSFLILCCKRSSNFVWTATGCMGDGFVWLKYDICKVRRYFFKMRSAMFVPQSWRIIDVTHFMLTLAPLAMAWIFSVEAIHFFVNSFISKLVFHLHGPSEMRKLA